VSKPISIADCVWWLDHLEEGCTIGDTDMKFIDRIQGALEQLLDEIDAANTANRDLFK
jgi:hypothetical protein